MYNLKFTLKQHTPLIHFQHDQKGATLRASEVKPKLDKYLIKSIGGREIIESKHPEWLLSEMNDALNYSLKIKISSLFTYPIEVPKINKNGVLDIDNQGEIKLEGFPCFFGNMGSNVEDNIKKFVFTEAPIEVELRSINLSFIDFLKKPEGQELISYFFNRKNFSSRQSKGFGSFSTADENQDTEYVESKYCFDVFINKIDVQKLRKQHNLRFPNVSISDNQLLLIDKWRTLFYKINLFHKVLKSGYNQQEGYVKSSLFKYFKEKHDIQWDKKSIKKNISLIKFQIK
jgi:hypothetical protein